jgi:hypothetical protein
MAANRAFMVGSAIAALISLLSLSIAVRPLVAPKLFRFQSPK